MSLLARLCRLILLFVIFLVLEAIGIGTYVVSSGFSARAHPGALETFVARRLRALAIPPEARAARNPMPSTPTELAEAREHFATECAICHANDGSGQSEMGQQFYPQVPDLRKAATQSLTDGEIYYIIMNGVRFTGMPAWATDDPQENSDHWKLVPFIRHLPHITAAEIEEMQALNPKSAHEPQERAPAGAPAHTHPHF